MISELFSKGFFRYMILYVTNKFVNLCLILYRAIYIKSITRQNFISLFRNTCC